MNRLPKNWSVRNDGSKLFKETVIAYLNKKRRGPRYGGTCKGGLYGVSEGITYSNMETSKGTILSLEYFIELSQETPDEIQTFKFC